MAKALAMHSALLRNGPPTVDGLRHFGVGCPMDIQDILHCRQSAATIILQVPLTPKPDFAKPPFPMPPSLIDPEAGLRCEVFMTLYYDPPVEPACDFEYCRCNVVASLGTIRTRNQKDKGPKDGFQGEVHPVPAGVVKAYPMEEEQVEHGFKWSPMNLYYRRFTRVPANLSWELRLEMPTRAGVVLPAPVNVFLIVTIRSPNPEARVYNELVTEMARLGWGASDLGIRSRERESER